MAIKYQVPRGTQDLLAPDIYAWQQTEALIRDVCALYGYGEVRTPIFEETGVFATANDSSDMVNKEMYTFTDNGQRSLTLRPEGTKGVIRSFVEHKMYGNPGLLPAKLFYMGPMFRYERPQKGRYRQFNQFGIEAIGAKSPLLDVETIVMGYTICRCLGIKNLEIKLNSLGDDASRAAYRQALKDHFKPVLGELCEDCQRRYEQNPLRILDCKVDVGHPSFKDIPDIQDYLTPESKEYFAKVEQGLNDLHIPYTVDPKLVRGLDYYTHTVYEAVPVTAAGQQATVFGGGRYDGLVDYFGGGPLSGVGFGMGMERLIQLARDEGMEYSDHADTDVYVIGLGDIGPYGLSAATMLRGNGYVTDMDYQGRGLKAQFKSAERDGAKVIVIIGQDEVANNEVTIKDVANQKQVNVPLDDMIKTVDAIFEAAEQEDDEQGHHHHDGDGCQCQEG